jgi:phosphatidylglycerol lysyltransferase
MKLTRILPALLSAAIVVVAGVVLYRTLSRIDAADVATSFAAIPTGKLLLGAAFTLLALASLAAYELAMLRSFRPGMPVGRPVLTALVAYPVGHAIGFGALSGGAIRYRSYSAVGLSTFEVGKIIVLSALPYAAGLGVLCALALLLDAPGAARLLDISPRAAILIGAALLLAHVAYAWAVLRLRRPLELKRLRLELPGPRLTALQYAFGIAEVLCGIAVLYVLLPDEAGVGFLSFAAVYVIAILAGLLSSVPAGLGVFESVMLLMLRDVPPDALLGSILAYRLVFELLPFVAGIMLFVGWEAVSRARPAPPTLARPES